MNAVTLFGRVDNEPELMGVPGRDVCELWIVVNGRRDKRPLHVKVVTFRALAEVCAERLSKGSQVGITGALRSDEWKTNGRSRQFVHSVVARDVQFVAAEDTGPDEAGARHSLRKQAG